MFWIINIPTMSNWMEMLCFGNDKKGETYKQGLTVWLRYGNQEFMAGLCDEWWQIRCMPAAFNRRNILTGYTNLLIPIQKALTIKVPNWNLWETFDWPSATIPGYTPKHVAYHKKLARRTNGKAIEGTDDRAVPRKFINELFREWEDKDWC